MWADKILLQPAENAAADAWTPIRAESVRDVAGMRQPDVVNHAQAPDRVKMTPLRPRDSTIALPALSVTAVECTRR